MSAGQAEPLVSVIMANHNGAAHIAAAVRSVLRQTETSLELILSDDGSTDDSLDRARKVAGCDERLIILASAAQTGPAGARNRALARARGRWIAIVDNDDAIHPERLKRLINAAEADRADIAADDLLTFYEGRERAPHAHLRQPRTLAPSWITPGDYLATNHLFGGPPSLGYLKPVFRRALLKPGVGYDETLRIAEDFDLVMRFLLDGARFRLYPELTYFYRKHARSISHRLTGEHIDAMLDAHDRLSEGRFVDVTLRPALTARRRSLEIARAFTDLITALKQKDLGRALSIALENPRAAWLLRQPLRDRLFKAQPAAPAAGPPRIALLSRQRIVGATNGSSAYVLALAGAIGEAGFAVDFIGASPKIFGRWPFFRLRPETAACSRIAIHGGVRLGDFMLATDPRVALNAALFVAERLLAKLGVATRGWSKPAEYAQGAPPTRADMLFIARHAPVHAAAVLCDYCFLTPLAPYALAFEAPNATIMHDLMSARVSDAAAETTPAAVRALTPELEFGLLGQGEAVIAIQAEEAAAVRAALPGTEIILAQHAALCADAPQPGEDDTLLFVGSNTAPNVVGLERFLAQSWPLIRGRRPSARLDVAGSVARGMRQAAPDGVRFLGVVPDLAPLYRNAGVVISPLHTGSGLKIKLIEALAAGKAVVGTQVTVQGVADMVNGALIVEDEPEAFAAAIVPLLGDSARRAALAAAALKAAKAHFSADACFADLISFVRRKAARR